jgi:hypothetical protein
MQAAVHLLLSPAFCGDSTTAHSKCNNALQISTVICVWHCCYALCSFGYDAFSLEEVTLGSVTSHFGKW